MVEQNASSMEQFLNDGGQITTFWTSRKNLQSTTFIHDTGTYTSNNTDADDFYRNVMEYVAFLRSNHNDVTCILHFTAVGFHDQYMKINA